MAVEYATSRAARARARARGRTQELSLLRRIDWVLVGAVGALVAFGLWSIAGITAHDVEGNANYFLIRQAIYAAAGAVGLAVALLIDADWYRRFWRVIYGGTALVMLLVFMLAPLTRGTRRWLDLGFFRFQPSEFGKLLFVLALAGFLAERSRRLNDPQTMVATLGLAALPMLLVYVQPDFGTALVYAAALAALFFVAGVRWLNVAAVGFLAALAAVAMLWALPAAGVHVLKDYQLQRFTGFLHPDTDPSGATYNVTQSKIAIGAGGFDGRGVENATQTKLSYVPEHATDFVFASLSEQRGFVGATILLLLYLLVVWRGLRVVTVARDMYSAVVAGGIVFAFLFQVFVNVGMTMGIAPVAGIPLPFVSVGGSSMIANLVAMGVLLSIHLRGAPMRRR